MKQTSFISDFRTALYFVSHGFQLGPDVGEALADLVMGQKPRVSLEAFRSDRFIS